MGRILGIFAVASALALASGVAQAAELASWNRMLEQRVAEQLEQIERVSRLKRFLSPQIAELILSSSTYEGLASHRRQVTIVFGDLRVRGQHR